MTIIFGFRAARLRFGLACVLAATALAAPIATAATVQQITNFGSNPSGIGMYLYTPTNVSARPAILVGVHACHGKGTDVCTAGAPFAAQADRFGFLLVCPSAISSDGCWDVHSTADLTHNGGGDASGIISMVNYVVQNNNGDSTRVYVAGHSSGGMMTNILLGSYPDVFKAGAAYAGVAFGCFASGPVDSLGWNATCATGNVTKTGAQWGDLVRAAFPGFTGTRPRMQLWHGTVDEIVNFHNFGEEIKEWTNVLGVSETPTSTENNALQPTWIRTRYADGAGVVQLEAIVETGQPHNLVVNAAEAVHFFGLDGSNPVPDAGATDAARDSAVADAAVSDAPARVDSAGNTGGATGTGGTGTGATGGTTGSGTGGTGGTGGSMGGSGGAGGTPTRGGATGGSATGGSSTTSPGTPDAGAASGGSTGTTSGRGASSGCSWAGGNSNPLSPVTLLLVLGVLLFGGRRRDGKRSAQNPESVSRSSRSDSSKIPHGHRQHP